MKNVSLFCICFLLGLALLHVDVGHAAQWKKEFERLCGAMEEARTLPADKVKTLIQESDALLKTIEGLNVREKKVYLFRLKKCKGFFEYVLDLKDSDKPSEPRPPLEKSM
jgi:hypothetical protein